MKEKQIQKFLMGILRVALLIFGVSAAAFFLLAISPIGPLQSNVGQGALGAMSQEQVEKLRAYWGADTPMIQRFFTWAWDFVRGDMGVSLLYRRKVSEILWEKAAGSLGMMALAWLLSGGMGFFLGSLAGAKQGKWQDRLITGYSLLMASTPAFFLALLLLMVFSVWLKILPVGFSVPVGVEASQVSFADRAVHAILPAAALSLTGISNIALHTREKMIEVMESDYVLFARARGEDTQRVIRRHCLRNIALPAMTLQFASVSEIFGGSVLVEQVFSYPGLGQAAVNAGLGSDVPLLLGITVVTAVLVFGGNALANLLYGMIDPRIKRWNGI